MRHRIVRIFLSGFLFVVFVVGSEVLVVDEPFNETTSFDLLVFLFLLERESLLVLFSLRKMLFIVQSSRRTRRKSTYKASVAPSHKV